MNFPNKGYSVIYADPPWSYRQHGTGPKSRGNAAQHYRTMNVEDICRSPVPQICLYFSEQYAVQLNSPAYRK